MTVDDIKLPQSETDFEEEEELFRQKILKMIIEKVMANRPELVEAVTSVANATMNTTLRWQKERIIGRLKEVMNCLMLDTKDKAEIIKAMEE